ncbi:enoyl-[acyl-carrier-protein] reductase FabK [Fusibacter tunisiensis]|jgi:enoyl-[acyl-carrier protein] reductase II|uniref:Probable nitronate monooxygenase n=1 Tax=Fusibacter tunisiensis TaxID=1008308 RepID=A0ABS2MRH8_9FIRM|nr:enoyl-[acyl-carrier protein] reductase II [Fusibacter tunisiensis]
MKTQLTNLLSIEYPIIQGGMAWISDAELASAVSNAGGLGVIAGGNAEKALIKNQIDLMKSKTNKPYALNIMLLSPHAEDLVDLAIEERVPVVITGAGSPGKHMERFLSAGIKVIPVVPTVALAKRMVQLGASAIIAEGTEAGGHVGELTTMTLVPQVADAVSVPVIAAGGIADGRGAAAAFLLGAEGIQVGTRFLVAKECNIHPAYKEMILKAKDTSTVVTGRSTGHPVRILKNKLYRHYMALEKNGASPEEIEALGAGALRKAAVLGDMAWGSVMAGQIAGLVQTEASAKEIIEDIFTHMTTVMRRKL